jgi:hypothetical protein
MVDRKLVPTAHRVVIAEELRGLLAEESNGEKKYTQASLGRALGGISQEAVRKALHPEGVGPAVRDGLLALLGVTIEELFERRGMTTKTFELTEMGRPETGRRETRHDSLECASRAASRLAEDGIVSDDEAWRLMRNLRPEVPTIDGFYRAALDQLARGNQALTNSARKAFSKRKP